MSEKKAEVVKLKVELEKQKIETRKYFGQLEKAKRQLAAYNILCSQKNFPIQQQYSIMSSDGHSKRDPQPRTIIPYWLAEEAYKHYSAKFGKQQSLERLAERGGFGREELLMLLRKEL